ncbi:uncharacterized protein LOC129582394 [Paramacrobiotus metropolitanus]|uniref:uncharacterized protein LOC129582394 n=1 Tax=Paramacrobiotus metropolitanus TaxID=2943436 RepID=UPI00244613B4|nr:uncharacterized protein LOC129582394 [Paramacrobiotus metropolitanus]
MDFVPSNLKTVARYFAVRILASGLFSPNTRYGPTKFPLFDVTRTFRFGDRIDIIEKQQLNNFALSSITDFSSLSRKSVPARVYAITTENVSNSSAAKEIIAKQCETAKADTAKFSFDIDIDKIISRIFSGKESGSINGRRAEKSEISVAAQQNAVTSCPPFAAVPPSNGVTSGGSRADISEHICSVRQHNAVSCSSIQVPSIICQPVAVMKKRVRSSTRIAPGKGSKSSSMDYCYLRRWGAEPRSLLYNGGWIVAALADGYCILQCTLRIYATNVPDPPQPLVHHGKQLVRCEG